MINKLMKKYGYSLVEENEHGVYYEKQEKQGYTHVVCVTHKTSGKHLMHSYDKNLYKVNSIYINELCGVEIPILLLMWFKAKSLGFKYNW